MQIYNVRPSPPPILIPHLSGLSRLEEGVNGGGLVGGGDLTYNIFNILYMKQTAWQESTYHFTRRNLLLKGLLALNL